MEDSTNSKDENSPKELTSTIKETRDAQAFETVVEVVEPVVSNEAEAATELETKPDKAFAEEVIQAAEEVVEEEVQKDSSLVPDPSAPVKGLGTLQSQNENRTSMVAVSEVAEATIDKNEEAIAAVSDSAAKATEEAALPISDINVVESSGVAESVSKETGDATTGGADHENSEIPRSTENQPFVAVNPHTRTSWKNCCGLLDLLKRSDQ